MAHEFKKLNTVEVINDVDDNVNFVVEQSGSIKRMNIEDIPQRAQADWNETNEASPAYILNKPDLSSVGGGNASITYFILSTSGGVGTVKLGDTWDTAVKLNKDIVVNAFANGIVRLKDAQYPNTVCTLLSYQYPASGDGMVYYVDSVGTIRSFSFNV